jgi:hypothetical protein
MTLLQISSDVRFTLRMPFQVPLYQAMTGPEPRGAAKRVGKGWVGIVAARLLEGHIVQFESGIVRMASRRARQIILAARRSSLSATVRLMGQKSLNTRSPSLRTSLKCNLHTTDAGKLLEHDDRYRS